MSISQAISSKQSLLDEHAVSELIGMSVASLRRWQLLKRGPQFLGVGGRVKYRPEDLQAWLTSRPSGGDVPDSVNSTSRETEKHLSVGRRRTTSA
jgi:hypothetical protein